ncbi:MAG: DNA-directed RNA polymerase subunit beta [Opitutales bacterium]|nr:DNA-directed RNA polymerase subunit beta [Opitutales bacterium]
MSNPTKNDRQYFGDLVEIIPPPNLIANQLKSYDDFLQKDVPAEKRKNIGLEAVFREVFPIESNQNTNGARLEYVSYRLEDPEFTDVECFREDKTFACKLYVTLRLVAADGTMKEDEIVMGDIPMITERGSFVFNGSERVVVSQLHRSPGLCFEKDEHVSGKVLYAFRIIPDRGTWLEVQFDQNDLLYVYLDRRRRRRKFLLTTLLRTLGYPSDEAIIKLFYKTEEKEVDEMIDMKDVSDYVLVQDVVDVKKGTVVGHAFEALNRSTLNDIKKINIKRVKVLNTSVDDGAIIRAIKKDSTHNEEEALKKIYSVEHPGEPIQLNAAKTSISRLFCDPKTYDLGKVGRYKINQKLRHGESNSQLIEVKDLVAATQYLCRLKNGDGVLDDIDHLGARRLRSVGELLQNECRKGLVRTERTIRERMSMQDAKSDNVRPMRLVNPKALATVIKDFFARSQLSQFMDQINPLAELSHKRRLSALGPGGLSRDRAGFEVRDVHPSHYGRICPIETPEGPNIGLINSLATYARVNEYGFIEAPYRPVKDGKVDNDPKHVEWLTADDEEPYKVAEANTEIDKNGKLVGDIQGKVAVRYKGEVQSVDPKDVNFIDISPKQVVSVATGLIPFLEHDDANRALMGSNMQRQGVPLLKPEAPLVGTGIEKLVAEDSCAIVRASEDGEVTSVTANEIVVTDKNKNPHVYVLRKNLRSNASTCFNQHPIVSKGQKVKQGDCLADGAATDHGELALGRNVLVAFMPWNGYNFEDAILLSERVLKDDVFTSIHIDPYTVEARETKLGPEEITRDIPNTGEDALKNLDRRGIIRVGAEVKAGDILVGKITPKPQQEQPPEEKLLRAIFGQKTAEVKDTSLRVEPGVSGVVMDVLVTYHTEKESEKSPSDQRRRIKETQENFRSQYQKDTTDLTDKLSDILLGEKIPLNVTNVKTGDVIIPAGRKITKTLLRKLASVARDIDMPSSPVREKIMRIVDDFKRKLSELERERDRKIDEIAHGKASDGTIKSVKVYLAEKRKIQVGDKMAGRHGNKGVVARIVPVEDMPYLPDGTPVDICLNPLGVPSRMNVGQVLETHMGWACQKLGIKVSTPIFDGIPEKTVRDYLKKAELPETGKTLLFDGKTGSPFDQDVVVGIMYMMKLNHLVEDKIHARATGSYALITQQPLGGKAQKGGQRLGEMEVWAMEGYGAAYTLQEFLTVKSDDKEGRDKMYENIVKSEKTLAAGIPQSFNVLVKEMQSLGLEVHYTGERPDGPSNAQKSKAEPSASVEPMPAVTQDHNDNTTK